MKKTQWQFTHRPDNQTDIKRILREARADWLTLVEVKGGPESLRGVYLDAQFISKHKEHWPKDDGVDGVALKPHHGQEIDGWMGPYRFWAPNAKQAHEQFCKSLEAARAAEAASKREYPPTVSVRAAGPELEQPKTELKREWFQTARATRWLPKPGDKFTAAGKKGREDTTFTWARDYPHLYVLTCTGSSAHYIPFKYCDGNHSQLTTDAYEFKKVQS